MWQKKKNQILGSPTIFEVIFRKTLKYIFESFVFFLEIFLVIFLVFCFLVAFSSLSKAEEAFVDPDPYHAFNLVAHLKESLRNSKLPASGVFCPLRERMIRRDNRDGTSTYICPKHFESITFR
jgi:hypothetical protein